MGKGTLLLLPVLLYQAELPLAASTGVGTGSAAGTPPGHIALCGATPFCPGGLILPAPRGFPFSFGDSLSACAVAAASLGATVPVSWAAGSLGTGMGCSPPGLGKARTVG